MTSVNFTYDDAIQAARVQLNDNAQRRWSDADILAYRLPKVLQQLYADRPDAFHGSYAAGINFKPSQLAPIDFDDSCFNAFVEALIADVNEQSEESVGVGKAGMADSKSERARRS